jgi:hypothetical protein
VFVATNAYAQARVMLEHHGFAVLAGPPEMGKTAIARMLALALLTDGWEVHECTRPEQVLERAAGERPQLFIADDAFGSTEYRADAADQWARALERILPTLGPRRRLIWTSRPAPLRFALRRIHQARGGALFPAPGDVEVDATALTVEERTLMLFRHVQAADVPLEQRRLVIDFGRDVVEHPDFTPERIRRFANGRLQTLQRAEDVPAAVQAELAEPTTAMATSLAALHGEHRELLLAMLDSPPGPVTERDLAIALRRHSATGLPKPPTELVDRLTDHFLRVLP